MVESNIFLVKLGLIELYNFIEYFHRIVETFPNYKAVKFKDTELTYAELNAKANTVALYLISKSVNYSDKVCLFFDESILLTQQSLSSTRRCPRDL